MAIFSRSKRKQLEVSPPLQQTQTQLKFDLSQENQCAVNLQPCWPNVGQHSTNSNGHSPQPQGWIIAPILPGYQVSVAKQDDSPHLPENPQKTGIVTTGKLRSKYSMARIISTDIPECIPFAKQFNIGLFPVQGDGNQYFGQSVPLVDLIGSKLNAVITQIDGESFSGDERELGVYAPPLMLQQEQPHVERELVQGKSKGMVNNSISSALTSTNYFAKVNLYANSRLPPNLPPLKLYLPTYPLLCLAAQYSERVYSKPSGQERDTHVDADWKSGTKAMVIKSVPMDDMNTIVFAIRGTQTFMDWAVNLNSAPTSPAGFLDDEGNLCHAGFLTAAKKMIKPVAARLRHLLQEDPGRSKCSLLITGHSAGGAVAALLYSHMLATSSQAESELNVLTGYFKRVHCVSFGAPPVSLLPLRKPQTPALKKSLFLSFVNEGDPVPRADKAYVRSLLDLYSTPAPGQSCIQSVTPQQLHPLASSLGNGKKSSKSSSTLNLIKRPSPKSFQSFPPSNKVQAGPYWPVPEATLSNAGRVVLLRGVQRYDSRANRKKQIQERMDDGVMAQVVTDELLRGVVWGDPICHTMKLYARRIEVLATNAVIGRG